MRHLPHIVVVLMAAAIGMAATAGVANPNPPRPPLRTSAAGAALPASVAQKPILRASSATMPAAKPVVAKVVVKPAPHKTVVAVKHRPARKLVVVRRGSPTIAVPLDEVRVVAFSQPVSTIYVGNPMIADVSMIDNKHAFVLGKSFGNTNVIALNADGKQVVNDPVNVFGHTGSTVVLHRGTQQTTYACAGVRCESAPTPGDDKDFSTRMEQVTAHQDAGFKAASASH